MTDPIQQALYAYQEGFDSVGRQEETGDDSHAVYEGVSAVIDHHTAQVRDWALSRLADLPVEHDRTAYANGEARALIDLLEHLAGPVPVSRSGVSEEVVPF